MLEIEIENYLVRNVGNFKAFRKREFWIIVIGMQNRLFHCFMDYRRG